MFMTFFYATLIFFAAVASVIFKYTAITTVRPRKDDPLLPSFVRLWRAYVARMHRIVASPWLWGAAGLWTAFYLALFLAS